MSSAASVQIVPTRLYSVEEYLRIEEQSKEKNEYKNGKIINMPGGTIQHNTISANLIREVGNAIIAQKKPCFVTSSDMKIQIPAHGFFNYSDGLVICGTPQFYENRKDAIVNPTLIIEVASDSTEVYDRTEKFDEYCTLESFKEYIIASQKQTRIEVWTRQDDESWNVQLYKNENDKIKLHTIDCELDMNNIYFNVIFENVGVTNRPQ